MTSALAAQVTAADRLSQMVVFEAVLLLFALCL